LFFQYISGPLRLLSVGEDVPGAEMLVVVVIVLLGVVEVDVEGIVLVVLRSVDDVEVDETVVLLADVAEPVDRWSYDGIRFAV